MRKIYYSKSLNHTVEDILAVTPEAEIRDKQFHNASDVQIITIDERTEGYKIPEGVLTKITAQDKLVEAQANKAKQDTEALIQAKMREQAIMALKAEGKLDADGKIKK